MINSKLNKNMNKNDNKQIQEKISQIETLIQNTKASLKSWANLIGQYHIQLKDLAQQLNNLKEQITMNTKNNNPNTQGGTK